MEQMKKIKICFISFGAYPLFNKNENSVFGGAEIDLYNLALKMQDKGIFEVTFIVGDYGQKPVEHYNGIKVVKFRYMNLERYRGLYYKLMRHLAMWTGLFRLDSEILITEASNEVLGWMALISKKLKSRKIIFRLAHDLDTGFRDVREKGYKTYLLYKAGIFNSDVIISQTDIQKKMLFDNMKLDSIVIKNGFDISKPVDFSQKDYILWVARAQDWKRPEIFAEMARQLPGERFVMIMPGENEIKDGIRKKTRDLDNFKLIDYVPFSEVQKYYDGARLFVNTSEYEGFPNAFVQACLGGTPILSFNVDPDGFIEKYDLGLLCNNDIHGAMDFIRQLTPERVAYYGRNAFGYVRENHDMEAIAKIYEDIIVRLHGDTGGK